MPEGRSLLQLGTDLDCGSSETPDEGGGDIDRWETGHTPADYFVRHNGWLYAGRHLIVDLWGADGLDDLERIEDALRGCVAASGATLLHIHLHHFTPNGGVSGVAVLAESHISIHSWPESGYAALDIFMCGDTRPEAAVPVLRQAFRPDRIAVEELLRGKQDD